MYTGKLQYPQNIIKYGSLLKVGYLTGGETPIGDTFHIALRYLNEKSESLRDRINILGYLREDISYLIVSMFGVEEAFDGVLSTPVSQASFSYRYLTEGSSTLYDADDRFLKQSGIKVDYGNFRSEAEEIKKLLFCKLSEVPLYLNGTELQKTIAVWRLAIGK